jgi:hypothetical protein
MLPPSFADECLIFQLNGRGVPGLDLDPKADYLDPGFSWFFSDSLSINTVP